MVAIVSQSPWRSRRPAHAKQHCPDPPKVSPHTRKIVVALGDCSNNPILRGLRVKMPNSKVGRVEEWVHESVRPNFPAKSTWRECHLQNFRLRRARGEGVWGSSFCSLTAVGRRVPRRKNRCGQGEKSVPPLTISARACILQTIAPPGGRYSVSRKFGRGVGCVGCSLGGAVDSRAALRHA